MMFTNFLKIAWRNLINNKLFSVINIIGIMVGFSFSLLIGLIIYYESTFEYFHKDKDLIYRVVSETKSPTETFFYSGATLALKDAIINNSNFEQVGSIFMSQPNNVTVKKTEKTFNTPKYVVFAEQDYFKIFNYTFLAGNAINPLENESHVVLTEKSAKRYFPDLALNEIIGETLTYDSLEVTITGIVEDLPKRTDLVFQEFISWPTILKSRNRKLVEEKNWNLTTSDFQLFVKLTPNADLEDIQKLFDRLTRENRNNLVIENSITNSIRLQPLLDMHFNELYQIHNWQDKRANKSLLKNFGLIALFLLLLGCANFINLTTAQATQRAKEIGILKILGCSKQQLITQFMAETFLLVLVSAVISVALMDTLLIVFADFVPEGLTIDFLFHPEILICIFILIVCITLLSGFYPAFVLSKYKPVKILKNNFLVGNKKAIPRKILTVIQFGIAQVFIIGALLVNSQINFMLTKDMGFNKETTVSVYQPLIARNLNNLKSLASKIKEVEAVETLTMCFNPPASNNVFFSDFTRKTDSADITKQMRFLFGDINYLNAFDIDLIAGRERKHDTVKEVVINETALKTLGFNKPEDAINEKVILYPDTIKIVGVMKDFHQNSLHNPIEPLVLRGDWYNAKFSQFQMISMKVKPLSGGRISEVINEIENRYKEVYPNTEMKLEFMNETVKDFYGREQKISKLLKWASGLSILISCLGLLGLVIYTTNMRVKEIGIRKVVGASVLEIYMLLCKEFIILVGIAFIVASPIAYYLVNQWLNLFTYKVSLSISNFLIGGLIMILFSFVVMSITTLKRANSNPVNSLNFD
ncbi:MAG TPA: ABC transporter permease [Yeosuana sp.]